MGYPIPKRENEMRATGSGPVVSYRLTGAELEELRRRAAPSLPTDSEGQLLKKPIAIKDKGTQAQPEKTKTKPAKPPKLSDPAEQARRARARHVGKKTEPPLPEFLALIAGGMTIADVERRWGMSKNSLYYWVKKWHLIGINPGMAKARLEQIRCERRFQA
ncbi:hypothetical protein [Paenibacillus sp. DYY-L-2]|uniref:hypothetical protein n=1 Tax=Paenibacillus sp. DYY-L-2 TaxID=3447013 RepID=UPI003F506C5C